MNTALTGSWIKRNIIAVIVIALLVGALGVLGLQVGKIKSENTKLQEDLASTKQKYDSMSVLELN